MKEPLRKTGIQNITERDKPHEIVDQKNNKFACQNKHWKTQQYGSLSSNSKIDISDNVESILRLQATMTPNSII